ncbi:MAG: carbon-nitrogen hydrolase [Alphaproteobacteria bacterium]|nr:carbon-nitrogen hydrolase [Alphaproteobacteria bacterium]
MSKKDALSIAHWAANMAHRYDSLETWCAQIRRLLLQAEKRGMDMFIMPEYISESWMHFAPATLKPTQELAWCAEKSMQALPLLQDAVTESGVALVAGSMPWAARGKMLNRSWVLFPNKKPAHHDKLVLTPFEMDPKSWDLNTGHTVRIFQWKGFNMAVLICLDVEMPALVHKLAHADIDLLLVPSMTEKPSGYHRVFDCAKARAIELMCAVSVVGAVGQSKKGRKLRDTNHSGAAVFLPCEEMFGYTGLHSHISMHGTAKGPGRILWAENIPLGAIRTRRKGKPEVWPGPWNARKIRIETHTTARKK